MACSKSEDEFWNESSSSGINFFDEDNDTSLSEWDMYNSVVQENTILPIHLIISNKSLKTILDDIDSTHQYVVPPPEETIRRMFLGEKCLFEMYQTIEDKLKLLDTALNIGDGNIILNVIFFLKGILKYSIFLNHLSKRKMAIKHYANFMVNKNSLQQLIDLYITTGNVSNLKDIYYLFSKDISNREVLHKKLEQFSIHHAQNLCSIDDKQVITENIKFIDLQMKYKYYSNSLIEQLIHLCKVEWTSGNGDDVVCDLKKQFQLDDFQYEWIIMSILCKMKNWEKLLATFIKTVWVIKKHALKSVIRPDLFITSIYRHNPPREIIEQFLLCTSMVESLYLAEKLKIHPFVINHHVDQKDKTSLSKYMGKIEPGNGSSVL